MALTLEQEKMLLENQGIVYDVVKKIGVSPSHSNYEDMISLGTIGLIKAIQKFDFEKGTNVYAYSRDYIRNEIFMHHRSNAKHLKNASLEEFTEYNPNPYGYTHVDKVTNYQPLLDPTSDFSEEVIDRQVFIKLFDIILNCLTPKDIAILLYWMIDIPEGKIGQKFDISQSAISRKKSKSLKKVYGIFNKNLPYERGFIVDMHNDYYQIIFTTKAVPSFMQAFSKVLKGYTGSLNFNLFSREDKSILQVPSSSDTFSFIADIFLEMSYTKNM